MSLSSNTEGSPSSWMPVGLPPRDFVRRIPLPQVVRIQERVHSPSSLDLSQPLVLYKAYKCRKIHARSLGPDPHGPGLALTGPALVIPDSYNGWFAIISEDGHTAGYFTCLEQVALAQVSHFLARDPLHGYRLLGFSEETGKAEYNRIVILPGQVLRFLGVYEDVNIRLSFSLKSFRKSDTRYAKCYSQTGDVVYIPLGSRGKFYTVARRTSRSVNHVFLLSQLLKFSKVPLTVRLVSGLLPRVPCGFTGVLRLEHIQEQDVVLACTLQDQRPTLLEIDMGSTFSFVPEKDVRKLSKASVYNRMIQFCVAEAEKWTTEIKVAHHVVPNFRAGPLKKSPSSGSKNSYGGIPTLKSQLSNSSKKSTSSMSSNPFKRLWAFHKSRKLKSEEGSETADEFERVGVLPRRDFPQKFGGADHIYESIPRPVQKSRYLLTRDFLGYRGGCEFEPRDDGYGTSRADSESLYDSIS